MQGAEGNKTADILNHIEMYYWRHYEPEEKSSLPDRKGL